MWLRYVVLQNAFSFVLLRGWFLTLILTKCYHSVPASTQRNASHPRHRLRCPALSSGRSAGTPQNIPHCQLWLLTISWWAIQESLSHTFSSLGVRNPRSRWISFAAYDRTQFTPTFCCRAWPRTKIRIGRAPSCCVWGRGPSAVVSSVFVVIFKLLLVEEGWLIIWRMRVLWEVNRGWPQS